MASTVFTNARLVLADRVCEGSLLVEGSRIAGIYPGEAGNGMRADQEVNAEGCFLAPGFIDIHTHGGGGADFMDGDLDSIYTASAMHLSHGTTSIVPTTVTSTKQSLLDFVDLFNQVDLRRPVRRPPCGAR